MCAEIKYMFQVFIAYEVVEISPRTGLWNLLTYENLQQGTENTNLRVL